MVSKFGSTLTNHKKILQVLIIMERKKIWGFILLESESSCFVLCHIHDHSDNSLYN